MRRVMWFLALVGVSILLSACSDSKDVSNELGINRTGFNANFNPSEAIIPFPSNLLFSGSLDGTLNIPVEDESDFSDPQVALNALDGFSTVAPISTTFSTAVDASSLSAENVLFFEVVTTSQGAVIGVERQLIYGVEYVAILSTVDDSGKTLVLVPLKPLNPSSSYMVGLTSGIKNTVGLSAGADFVYVLTKSPNPLIDGSGNNLVPALEGFPDPDATAQQLEGLRQLVQTQEAAIAGQGIDPDDIVLSWTFNTQSVGDVLSATRASVIADAEAGLSLVNPISIGTTAQLLPGTPGLADIYVGSLDIPYFLQNADLSPLAPLDAFWQGLAGSNLTRYNPTPVKTSTETIPMLTSLPNAGSGKIKPEGGWPVVIFQHGITSNRTAMLAAADSLALAGFAVVAIDMPLHGLDDTSPLYSGSERTFDLDFIDNASGVPGSDGLADSSGTHFINLTSLLTTRDNGRQAVSDLFTLTKALATMDVDGGGADFDTSRVYFVGHSLGGILGSVFLALEPTVEDAVLGMAGGGFGKMFDGSATFGPLLEAGLAANGVLKGSADYEAFIGAFQTVVDAADPINYTTWTGVDRGLLHFEVLGDQVVPNNVMIDAPAGTVPSPLAGTDPLVFYLGLETVSSTVSGSNLKVQLRFTSGDHRSLLDPSTNPQVTQVMQNAMSTFLATDGGIVTISDDTFLE